MPRLTKGLPQNAPLDTTRPLLLDLFCGAGLAADGYYRAGFQPIGIDIRPQLHYPYPFLLADALSPPLDLSAFTLIHASPPCQAHTVLRHITDTNIPDYNPPDLIDDTRSLLRSSGRPYVIENVPGSPLRGFRLCGSMFGLTVQRHRIFESSHLILAPDCRHTPGPPVGIYGWQGSTLTRGYVAKSIEEARTAMGLSRPVPWMPLTQGIPPAYTEFIGTQLLPRLTPVEFPRC